MRGIWGGRRAVVATSGGSLRLTGKAPDCASSPMGERRGRRSRRGCPMPAPGSPWLALVVLLAVLAVASPPAGRPSEATPVASRPQATDQRGTARSDTSPTLPGDFNGDGIVDILDYGVWRQKFGATNCGNPSDADGDCLVDVRDYA